MRSYLYASWVLISHQIYGSKHLRRFEWTSFCQNTQTYKNKPKRNFIRKLWARANSTIINQMVVGEIRYVYLFNGCWKQSTGQFWPHFHWQCNCLIQLWANIKRAVYSDTGFMSKLWAYTYMMRQRYRFTWLYCFCGYFTNEMVSLISVSSTPIPSLSSIIVKTVYFDPKHDSSVYIYICINEPVLFIYIYIQAHIFACVWVDASHNQLKL